MMRAGIIDPTDRPVQVRIAEVPEPRVAPAHVKLSVKAVSVDQFWDRASGSPFVPGSIVAGDVIEVGAGVERYGVGQRVMGLCRSGGLAERVVIPAAGLGPVPDSASYVQATMAAAGVAASLIVSDLLAALGSSPRTTVAVDDASTSFGCFAGAMLRDAGVETIGVVGHDVSADTAVEAGFASTIVRAADEPLTVSLLRVTDGAGVAGFLDHRAATTLEDAWRVLGAGGVFVRCDLLRSPLAAPSPQAARRLAELGARWTRFDGTAALVNRAREIPERRDAVLDGLLDGRYAVPVRAIPFDSIGTLRAGEPGLDGHVVVTL